MVPFEYSGFRLHEHGLEPIGDPTPEQALECLRMLMQLRGAVDEEESSPPRQRPDIGPLLAANGDVTDSDLIGELPNWREDEHTTLLKWKSHFRDWPIDVTLTPDTARERGYKWSHDVPYIEALRDHAVVAQEIAKMIGDHGYLLGNPAELTTDEAFAVYEPEGLREARERERNRKTRT